ncbi:hypothetical protein [Nostoc sp. 2RC]|uniref:hypothetical protein n=1 Tax=Nostoc sp. 2RC TaxID=2485484 RepID=UPI0016287172|nr:hypothetical protein [Nostoc sp. 2RC]MBC1241088.1 hypothetical protein [Nostoc sp. 2RC]
MRRSRLLWLRSPLFVYLDAEELGNVFESVMDGLSGHLSILTNKQMGNLGQSQSVGEAI